jgi:hypothetical protein
MDGTQGIAEVASFGNQRQLLRSRQQVPESLTRKLMIAGIIGSFWLHSLQRL